MLLRVEYEYPNSARPVLGSGEAHEFHMRTPQSLAYGQVQGCPLLLGHVKVSTEIESEQKLLQH